MLRDLLDYYRRNGLVSLLIKVLKGTFFRLQRLVVKKEIDVFFLKDLTDNSIVDVPNKITIQDIHTVNLATLISFIREHNVDSEISVKRTEYCIEHGYYGTVAKLDNEIIGYGWWLDQTMNHPYLSLYQIELKKDEIFAIDLFIAPRFRGKHNAMEFMVKSQNLVKEQGYNKIISNINLANRRSLWLHNMLGWRKFEQCEVLLFFSILLYTKGRFQLRVPLWY